MKNMVTKSAKLYFNDVGLASYLLGIENIISVLNYKNAAKIV